MSKDNFCDVRLDFFLLAFCPHGWRASLLAALRFRLLHLACCNFAHASHFCFVCELASLVQFLCCLRYQTSHLALKLLCIQRLAGFIMFCLAFNWFRFAMAAATTIRATCIGPTVFGIFLTSTFLRRTFTRAAAFMSITWTRTCRYPIANVSSFRCSRLVCAKLFPCILIIVVFALLFSFHASRQPESAAEDIPRLLSQPWQL